jgi:3-oxoacyl-[acyl-carrier-protein] synthase II
MDGYSRLGLSAIALALKDAGLENWVELRNISVMASTVYGCLETDAAYYDTVRPEGGRLASPNLFAYTLANTFLGEAAIQFGLTGAGFVLHEAVLSGLSGLQMAMNAVSEASCEAALSGVCDTGPASSLGLKGRAVPGSLFFVLQKKGESQRSPYGDLTQDFWGIIRFEGQEIENLFQLAEWCSHPGTLTP